MTREKEATKIRGGIKVLIQDGRIEILLVQNVVGKRMILEGVSSGRLQVVDRMIPGPERSETSEIVIVLVVHGVLQVVF